MIRRTLCALALAGGLWTSPALAQANSWQHKWWWGAQGGLIQFKTPTSTDWQTAVSAGGSWFITGTRSALYVAYDQVIYKDATNSAIVDATSPTGIQTLSFNRGRSIQAFLYVVPIDGPIQPYLGGGFAINQISNAAPQNLAAIATTAELETVLRTIDETSTKAFPVFSGGLQMRFGGMALFGQYQFMPTGQNFLIDSGQHVFSAGMRIAVTGSREEVTTGR